MERSGWRIPRSAKRRLGNLTKAKQAAAEGLRVGANKSGRGDRSCPCLCHGRRYRAHRIAGARFEQTPSSRHANAISLAARNPGATRAQPEASGCRDRKPAARPASPSNIGQIEFVLNLSCLYPTYIRGQAYLAAGQGKEAAAEFQKILDHSGIVWNCWTGALAHLGVARANALEVKTSQGADADAARVRALAAYKHFLTVWKDADPDVPILKEAKAEYAKLQ